MILSRRVSSCYFFFIFFFFHFTIGKNVIHTQNLRRLARNTHIIVSEDTIIIWAGIIDARRFIYGMPANDGKYIYYNYIISRRQIILIMSAASRSGNALGACVGSTTPLLDLRRTPRRRTIFSGPFVNFVKILTTRCHRISQSKNEKYFGLVRVAIVS